MPQNPYAIPRQQFIKHGDQQIPIDQYFDQHVRTMYEMLPFAQTEDNKFFTTEEKIYMANGILRVSKGSSSDNMFLCGMNMANLGDKMVTKAKQRIYWDALHEHRSDYTEREYDQYLKLIQEAKINQCDQLIKKYES